jgi:transposase
MKRFIEEDVRTQSMLLPDTLDDYVAEDNPARAIEAFVGQLDLMSLGFENAEPKATGRPGYHPATLLKLYIYGYLNRIQSSRRLERETQRNLELIWLCGRLTPDFKTIADFRKDNGPAIRRVCREFVLLCRKLDLFSEAIVAIDGSKFKAVNNRDKNFTDRKLQARLAQLEESVGRYLDELDRADRQPAAVSEGRVTRLKEKIAGLKAKMKELKEIGEDMKIAPDGQVSQTDPDARSMATSGRGTGVVGYNVQIAVDTKHHLLVAHEVTNLGHDRTQLAPMAEQAKGIIDQGHLTVVADRGYFSGPQIKACEDQGIETLVPKPDTSGNKAAGRFGRQEFIYDAAKDEYLCPAGQRAIRRFTTVEHGLTLHKYWTSACSKCAIKSQCTTNDYRRISRWEHEHVLERMLARLAQTPDAMKIRRRTVEHVFGTLKSWMGSTHFLTKTLPRVSTEMSLHVLAYNLKRIMKIFGVQPLIRAMAG